MSRLSEPTPGIDCWHDDNLDGDGTTPNTIHLRLPGQCFDAESALPYKWHRYYVTATGRCLPPELFGIGGETNLFEHVEGNPLSCNDPEGLQTSRPQWWNDMWGPGKPPGHRATAGCAERVLPTATATPSACEEECGIASSDAAARKFVSPVISQPVKLLDAPDIPLSPGCTYQR